MEWDDEGLGDEPPASPLLPPDDRLWRHPSEVVAGAPGSVRGAGAGATRAPGRPSVVTVVALTSCLSVLLTVGIVAVVRPFRERVPVARPATVPVSVTTSVPDGSSTAAAASVAALAAQVRPAIAQVVARTAAGERSWGSGVLVRADGLLLTANHVVDGAEVVRVVLDDGRELVARLVGGDPDTDVAVLDLEGDGYPTATLADSRDDLKVGDRTITIGASSGTTGAGSPLVRVSMVSAMNQEAGIDGRRFVDVIRTDSAVEPGCSGGAVVDTDGRVVGIAMSNMSTAEGATGFATPIDVAWSVAEQLVATGKVTRAWLGIDGDDHEDGAVVRSVRPGGPAHLAGLRADDVIVAIDGTAVPSIAAVVVRLRSYRPGQQLTVRLQRAGGPLDVAVTLGEKPTG
ncbi:MAG TPA: trypsin-like peptidase domain-containing protein [Acidimicrobiales bacterium]|nr:trypsin-like peptidase domain-containing protein [Acidimicrobiales bacterium]